MKTIDWINPYEGIDDETLEPLLKKLLEKGWRYDSNNLFNFHPAKVTTPDGVVLKRKDITRILMSPLVFGNQEQIQALKSAEFFQLAQAFYNDADDYLEEVSYERKKGEIESLSCTEVDKEVTRLEKQGYYFFVDSSPDDETQFYTPDRVALPNGRILDESELEKELEKDPLNKNLLNAKRMFELCFSEQYGDKRFEHLSFVDEKDILNCQRKYSN